MPKDKKPSAEQIERAERIAQGANEYGAGESDSPAGFDVRTDPRQVTPFALPVEAKDLNPRHIRFVDEWLLTGNAGEAYAKAFGYDKTEKWMTTSALRLLDKDALKSYAHARMTQLTQHAAVTPEFISAELLNVYRKASEAVPIFNKKGEFTGRYQFDGRTAVAALLSLGKLHGHLDKDKNDGRSQNGLNIAIVLNKYNRPAAEKLSEHLGIAPPHVDALPKVDGFPKVAIKKREPQTIDGTSNEVKQ